MDNLKKYLQQHLDKLDTDVPDEKVWQRIQKEAIPVLPKRMAIKAAWRYAAAACVLLCIAVAAFIIGKKQTVTGTAVHNVSDTGKLPETIGMIQLKNTDSAVKNNLPDILESTSEQKVAVAQIYVRKYNAVKKPAVKKRRLMIDPSQLMMQDVENNYGQLVNMQLQQLRVMPVYAESPDYFSTFKQQFKQIETDEIGIKKEIRQHGLTDELLQQLININQHKLNILKDLRAEINKLNNKVKQPQNRQDSSQSFYLNM